MNHKPGNPHFLRGQDTALHDGLVKLMIGFGIQKIIYIGMALFVREAMFLLQRAHFFRICFPAFI